MSLSHVLLFETPWTTGHRFICPWDFPGRDTGVGCHLLLQVIFPTQGPNLHLLLHCRQILYHWATREDLSYINAQFKKIKEQENSSSKHKDWLKLNYVMYIEYVLSNLWNNFNTWQPYVNALEWSYQAAEDIFTPWSKSSTSSGFNKYVFKKLNVLQSCNLTNNADMTQSQRIWGAWWLHVQITTGKTCEIHNSLDCTHQLEASV